MNQPRFLNEELIYSYCRLVKFAENFRETGGERRQPTIPQELPLTSLPQSDRYREPFPTAQSRQPVIELTFSITAELFWPPTSIFGQASTEHTYLWHFFIHLPILSCLHCVCALFDLCTPYSTTEVNFYTSSLMPHVTQLFDTKVLIRLVECRKLFSE